MSVWEDSTIKFEDCDGEKRKERILQGLELNRIETDSLIGYFSHACVYTYNNGKWDKFGVEGALYICSKDYKRKSSSISSDNSDDDGSEDEDIVDRSREIHTFHTLIILNRVDFNNFAFPFINIKSFSVQDQFIMIKYNLDKSKNDESMTSNDEIFALWMYDTGEIKAMASTIRSVLHNKEYDNTKYMNYGNMNIPKYYYCDNSHDEPNNQIHSNTDVEEASPSSSSSLSRFIRLPLDMEAKRVTKSDDGLSLGLAKSDGGLADVNGDLNGFMSLSDITSKSFR